MSDHPEMIYISEARLQDMDTILEMAAATGLKLERKAALHSYSLVAKRGDDILAAAVATFAATGEAVVTLVTFVETQSDAGADKDANPGPADEANQACVWSPGMLDQMAHKACKKIRAQHNNICRIEHPNNESFWRSTQFIRPAA